MRSHFHIMIYSEALRLGDCVMETGVFAPRVSRGRGFDNHQALRTTLTFIPVNLSICLTVKPSFFNANKILFLFSGSRAWTSEGLLHPLNLSMIPFAALSNRRPRDIVSPWHCSYSFSNHKKRTSFDERWLIMLGVVATIRAFINSYLQCDGSKYLYHC